MPKPITSLLEPTIDNRLLDDRGPTTERLQRSRESPLVAAHSKRQIDRAQYAAGQKFYGHWFKSGLCERYGSIDLTRIFAGADPSLMARTELQASHRWALRHALEVLKAEKSYVLQQFICHEQPLSDIGAAMGYRDREWGFGKALGIARAGLAILCKEWGIESIDSRTKGEYGTCS